MLHISFRNAYLWDEICISAVAVCDVHKRNATELEDDCSQKIAEHSIVLVSNFTMMLELDRAIRYLFIVIVRFYKMHILCDICGVYDKEDDSFQVNHLYWVLSLAV